MVGAAASPRGAIPQSDLPSLPGTAACACMGRLACCWLLASGGALPTTVGTPTGAANPPARACGCSHCPGTSRVAAPCPGATPGLARLGAERGCCLAATGASVAPRTPCPPTEASCGLGATEAPPVGAWAWDGSGAGCSQGATGALLLLGAWARDGKELGCWRRCHSRFGRPTSSTCLRVGRSTFPPQHTMATLRPASCLEVL